MAHREIPQKIYSTTNADKKESTDKKYLFFFRRTLRELVDVFVILKELNILIKLK